jgi:hypothetical protein
MSASAKAVEILAAAKKPNFDAIKVKQKATWE